jgi:hypothetical protein
VFQKNPRQRTREIHRLWSVPYALSTVVFEADSQLFRQVFADSRLLPNMKLQTPKLQYQMICLHTIAFGRCDAPDHIAMPQADIPECHFDFVVGLCKQSCCLDQCALQHAFATLPKNEGYMASEKACSHVTIKVAGDSDSSTAKSAARPKEFGSSAGIMGMDPPSCFACMNAAADDVQVACCNGELCAGTDAKLRN